MHAVDLLGSCKIYEDCIQIGRVRYAKLRKLSSRMVMSSLCTEQ